jgi:hypothetical protein
MMKSVPRPGTAGASMVFQSSKFIFAREQRRRPAIGGRVVNKAAGGLAVCANTSSQTLD